MKLESQLQVFTASGVAPFTVNRTTLVTNLNAQYLNGQLGTYYAAASSLSSYLPLTGGTMTGHIIGAVSGLWNTYNSGSFTAYGNATNPALIAFHRPGFFATNFGLDTDGVIKIGGWSNGGPWPVLHSNNFNSYALPLAGGTLTGALNGTTGAFSGTLTATGGITQNGNQVLHAGNFSAYALPYTGGTLSGALNGTTAAFSGAITQAGNQVLHAGNYTSYLPARWATGRTISLTGDVTGTSVAFDGTAALSFAATLANSGATAGTYTKVTVNTKGLVTAGASLASADLPTYTGTITSGQVTTGLGFTPYNATNPSNYITSSSSITGYSGGVSSSDTRSVVTTPQTIDRGVVFDFKTNTTDGLSDGGSYFGEMTFRPYGSGTDWSGTLSHQLGFTDAGNIWQRSGSNTTWGAWKKLLDTTNFSSHALPLAGGTLTGSITATNHIGPGTGLTGTATSLNIGGNAATATNLAWSGITSKPTTLAGFGITDAALTNGASNQNFSANAFYQYDWLRIMSDTGIYWQSGTYAGWHIHPQAAWGMSLRSASTDCGLQLRRSDNTLLGSLYSDGTSIGFLNASNGWGASFTIAGAMNRGSVPGSLVTGNISGNAATATRTSSQSGYAHAGTGMVAFYNWGGTSQGTNAPDAGSYTTGISVGSHPNDQAYGFQIANNMWASGLWTRNYNSGFGSWVRLLDSSNYTSYPDATKLPLAGGTLIGALNGTTAAFSGAITQAGNQVLHAGNYTSYTLPRGGSWYGANLPGTRWGGMTSAGGEIVFGQDLPAAGQMGILIDGCYIAAENNGFWSLASSNDWTTRRGMYFDGTYLRFDYNSATAYFSNALIGGNQVLHAGNYTSYPDTTKLPLAGGTLTGQVQLKAGHGNTRFQLYYNYANDTNHAYAGFLTLWSSEPGITHPNGGIGANINMGGQYYGRAGTGNSYGVYLRFDVTAGESQFYNTTGVPGVGGGQGTLRAKIAADGEIYATASQYKVLHAGNYGGYSTFSGAIGGTELNLSGQGMGAYNLMKYSGLRSGDWQTFTTTEGQLNVIQVNNFVSSGAHSNYPTGVYQYGAVMSWRTLNHSFQLYASHTGDLAYKTQWGNDNYSGWRRILDSTNYAHAANMNQYVRTTDNPTFNSVLITSEISISKNNARNLQIQGSGGGDSGLLGRGSSGQFAFQLYGSGGGDYGFLNGAWAGWDIKKTVSGALYLNANDTYYLNPASTTNLLSLTVANTITGSITGNAGTATSLANFTNQSGARYTTDFNSIVTTGFFNAEATPTNSPGGSFGQLISVKGIDTGLQIYGGYVNDNLWFRGWHTSGGTFTAWRAVVHSGNIASQTVATAGSANAIADGVVSTTAKLANSVVTYAKIQNVTAYTVLGNSNASSAQAPVEISMATLAGMVGSQYTTSIGNVLPDRVFMSNDANIKFAPRDTAKAHLGLTGKYGNSRPNITGNTSYWVGSMGWGATDWNSVFDWGSGFTDSWDSPANNPGDTSHHVGVQALHYTNGSNRYGWQMVNGVATNRWWLRDVWGGGFSAWREIIHSGNIASQTVATAGSVAWTNVSGRPTAVSSFSNDSGYITSGGSISGSAGSVAASGITGQTGMWTSAARPGPYRLYRRDSDDAYSVQTYWTGSYWRLDGYYSNNTVHAGCIVAYADAAASSASCSGNAASVTDGVYLSTNQSISGVKTFSSAPVATNIAKAWVHYNMNTNTINASYNVSSVTDNGTGVCTVNFSSAMVDANYVVAGTATYGYDDQDLYGMILTVPRRSTAQQAGSCRLSTEFIHAAALYDCVAVRAVFYR